MPHSSESFPIQNINELRHILQEISQQNQTHHINDFFQNYLIDENEIVKKISLVSLEQLNKKSQQLQNIVQFALHLLNEIETKNDQLTVNSEKLLFLEQDLNKVSSYNDDLHQRLEIVQEESNLFKSRIQEQESFYLSEIEHNNNEMSLKISLENLQGIMNLNLGNNLNISTAIPNLKANLTQRLPSHQPMIPLSQHQSQLLTYQSSLNHQSQQIADLHLFIKNLQQKIHQLQNQLQLKSSQLELSQLYFKEKIDIISNNEIVKKQREIVLSQVEVKDLFRQELARVDSVMSIGSVSNNRTEYGDDDVSQLYNNDSDAFYHMPQLSDDLNLINTSCSNFNLHHRHPEIRRSLIQQFFTNLTGDQQHSMYASSIFPDQQESSLTLERKKSISVSTADMRKMVSRGVQTSLGVDDRKIVRKSSELNKHIIGDKMNESFFESVTSLFTKKNVVGVKECNVKQEDLTVRDTKENSFFTDSSIGTMFKGIFDYATKKIVTNRIHKRKSSICQPNLDYSFLEELKPMKRQNYVKGRKCH